MKGTLACSSIGTCFPTWEANGKAKPIMALADEGIMVQNQQAATEKYRNYPMWILEFKN
jgi:hypothetical protein